ncbi:DUF523 domain-containing protein [Veillonella criceti]|uniref:Uncharacterized conserved protein n=1 Tax=Veillonella criceti TaxID=103891 RepID=A0A380NML9_9FIRM|nr:DUF523 domain-containing protein [Veillonella criceti]SUP43607.1 Uncharacterized conserved protein [Veillonella criceti]
MKILCSACLLGENCKYNGGNNYSEALARFIEQVSLMAKPQTEDQFVNRANSSKLKGAMKPMKPMESKTMGFMEPSKTAMGLGKTIMEPIELVTGDRESVVEIIPVCPEVLGGLPTPRIPAEIVDGEVRTRDGQSVDREFRQGAWQALKIAREKQVDVAILQSRSPSCGVKEIYDGTFSGTRIAGSGIFASLLKDHGIEVIDVEDLIV